MGCPLGILYETAPEEHVILGCPEGTKKYTKNLVESIDFLAWELYSNILETV